MIITFEISGPTTATALVKSRSPFFNTCNRIGTTIKNKFVTNCLLYLDIIFNVQVDGA